jgi:hypothetical protein
VRKSVRVGTTTEGLRVGDGGRDIVVHLAAAQAGRLHLESGVARLMLRAERRLGYMMQARFEGPPPNVRREGETLTIRYPRALHPFEWRRRRGDVSLNASIPWDVSMKGGMSQVVADLQDIDLRSLQFGGGVSDVEALLPPPGQPVTVELGGGVSNVRLLRPAEVPVRLRISGGASKLQFDQDFFGAVGGRTRLQSDGFDDATVRYDIAIRGGASRLTVGSIRRPSRVDRSGID